MSNLATNQHPEILHATVIKDKILWEIYNEKQLFEKSGYLMARCIRLLRLSKLHTARLYDFLQTYHRLQDTLGITQPIDRTSRRSQQYNFFWQELMYDLTRFENEKTDNNEPNSYTPTPPPQGKNRSNNFVLSTNKIQ